MRLNTLTSNPKLLKSVLLSFYELPRLVLEGQFYSISLRSNEPIQTEVISITLDEKRHYMHRFVRYHKNVQAVGAAYGTFACEDGQAPERYEGGVIFLDVEETHKRRQTGVKLPFKDVKALRHTVGSDWARIMLNNEEWVAKFCKLPERAKVKAV